MKALAAQSFTLMKAVSHTTCRVRMVMQPLVSAVMVSETGTPEAGRMSSERLQAPVF